MNTRGNAPPYAAQRHKGPTMKTITIHSLPAMLPILLLSGLLLAAEPASKNKAPASGTQGAAKRPAAWYGPPPTKKVVYKKVGERELSLHVFEPAGQEP